MIDSNAKVMIWTREQLAAVYEKRADFQEYVNDWLRYKQSALIERLAELAAYNTEDRIRFAILRLRRQLGFETQDGIKLPPFTHWDLAEYVGTSREIVSQIMGRLARAGLISYNRSGILVRCLEKGLATGN